MSALLIAAASPIEPTTGQLAWVLAALALLAVAMALTARAFLLRLRRPGLRHVGRSLAALALLIDLGVVLYRNMWRQWSCPINDNLDSALLLAAMLGGVLFYLVWVQPGRSAVDPILLPLVILLQALASADGLGGFHVFEFTGLWRPMHLATLLLAALLAAAAAAGGVMYLLLNRGLRGRRPDDMLGGLPSLERLDRLMQRAVLWAFVLLTLAIITGLLVFAQLAGGPQEASLRRSHAALAVAPWLVYLTAVIVRLAPRFRGRPLAWLCIGGLALLLAVYLVASY